MTNNTQSFTQFNCESSWHPKGSKNKSDGQPKRGGQAEDTVSVLYFSVCSLYRSQRLIVPFCQNSGSHKQTNADQTENRKCVFIAKITNNQSVRTSSKDDRGQMYPFRRLYKSQSVRTSSKDNRSQMYPFRRLYKSQSVRINSQRLQRPN